MHPPMPSDELINFCLQPLVDLSSNTVSADDHPLTNLVSTTPSVRSRGFRVEHFIRPPIQIEFEFRLPVNVACIIVQAELAPLSEMRLELAASFHTASTSTNLATICHNVVIKDSQTMLLLENKAFKRRDGKVFSISKTDLTSCQVEGSFMSESGRSGRAVVTVQPLKHPNILAKLRQLRLTVSRISGPKPLSLKSLEVWGSLSTCSQTTSNQVNCLQSCLAAVKRERCAAGSDRVNLYCSKNYSPEQCPVAAQQDTVTANDLHRGCVDTGQACSYVSDQKTMSSHEGKLWEVACGSLGQEECSSGWLRVQGRPVFGGAETDTQEVGHIKELTSENKKPLKPQQRGAWDHLHGCSHNIGKGKEKPGSGSSRSSKWLEGRNGSPPSTSLPTGHNITRVRDEDTSQLSCGNKVAILQHQHKQQQPEERQTQPTTSGDQEIPSEFLDKITYDVMHVPMLLPSGHCVDRSTVEKLAHNDTLYGRPPTDPFTGIPFSGTSKPEFFPELKLRLDRFLSSNVEDRFSAQTLGSANEISAHLNRVGHSRGDVQRKRDVTTQEGASRETPRKRLRSMTMNSASYALDSSCLESGERAGIGPVWECPTVGSLSYQRASPGPAIKDQRTTHRMLHHGSACSSTQPNHSFQDGRNQFEEEVAGSLDHALNQLLSKN